MGRSYWATGLLMALALAGCGETFKAGPGGAAGEGGGSSAGAGTGAGSPSAAGAGNSSAGTSSGGGKGGAATAGASTGGATGGVATGGMSPGGGGAAGSAECEADEDCMLFDDCCSCSAQPKDVKAPACDAVCIQSACSARGIRGVGTRCVAKRCVLGLTCNASMATCAAMQPSCASGLIPSVVQGCWGPCIHPTECRDVTDCEACAAGSSCVTQSLFMPSTHCVSVSAACEAAPSCECVDACSQACSDVGGKVDCFCLAC